MVQGMLASSTHQPHILGSKLCRSASLQKPFLILFPMPTNPHLHYKPSLSAPHSQELSQLSSSSNEKDLSLREARAREAELSDALSRAEAARAAAGEELAAAREALGGAQSRLEEQAQQLASMSKVCVGVGVYGGAKKIG